MEHSLTKGAPCYTMDKRILIGEIATAHGIKGFVKVKCFADDPGLLEGRPLFTGETGDDTIRLTLKNAMNNFWLADVETVNDRTEAEALRGTKLYIDRAALPAPDDGEYYYEDLKDMRAVDEDGNAVGTVIGVTNFGAGDLLDIRPQDGGDSFYLPFQGDAVQTVDLAAKTITVRLPGEMV